MQRKETFLFIIFCTVVDIIVLQDTMLLVCFSDTFVDQDDKDCG